MSQRLRAAIVSPRWALRIAEHSAFLPPCLPGPEEHGTPSSLAEKPGRGQGGRERRAAGSPIQVASPAVTCLCSQKLLALPATETGQPQSQMTLEQSKPKAGPCSVAPAPCPSLGPSFHHRCRPGTGGGGAAWAGGSGRLFFIPADAGFNSKPGSPAVGDSVVCG